MVGQLANKQCGLLIDHEQYKSVGFNPSEVEELKKKVEASTRLVERAQQEFEEKELLTRVNMKESRLTLKVEPRRLTDTSLRQRLLSIRASKGRPVGRGTR